MGGRSPPPEPRVHWSIVLILRRALCYGARPFFGAVCLLLSHCAPIEPDAPRVEAPDADTEARGVFLQLNRPGTRLEIRADSISEHSERQAALAMGDVRMDFYDASGRAGVQLRAERMHLDHRTGAIDMAAEVVMIMGDSLSALADSLRWHPQIGRAHV